jgi:predicted regulator of Ras-like GTPase activity (Roadblock/LC7/MglB family)
MTQVPDQVTAALRGLRNNVIGIVGSLVATRDGLLVAHDLGRLEPTRLAALACTVLGLSQSTTQVTEAGQLRETVIRGYGGYFVVYAAGGTATLAVMGDTQLNLGMLHLQSRPVLELVAAMSVDFPRFAATLTEQP